MTEYIIREVECDLLQCLVWSFFWLHPHGGGSRSLTLYLDGAREEYQTTIITDKAAFSLPPSIKEGSLRIKTLDGCQIEEIVLEPGKSDPQITRSIAKLMERRGALVDRLKALELRESIFISAAKSQSGKSLRKSKSNPEPLTAVKQGTEYAITQLEGVYRARRIAEAELKSLEEKTEAMKNVTKGKDARIRLSRKGCRIEASYIRTDFKWIPTYDFRLDKTGEADVFLRAIIPRVETGAHVSVVPSLLNSGDCLETVWANINQGTKLVASFRFPVEQEKYSSKPISSISFIFKNQSRVKLPPGETSCFFQGEYLGKALFKGAGPGESMGLAFGN